MRRLCLLMILVASAPVMAQGGCVKTSHPDVSVASYYASVEGLKGNELRVGLNSLIRGHTSYRYSPCIWEILKEADEDPNDSSFVIGLYTNRSIRKSMQDNGSRGGDAWNREHVWAKSHGFPSKSQHAYTDAHHIRAADRSVNTDRSDHDFDAGGAPDDECGDCREGNGTWEPPDRVKGDIARMLFYMDVRYEGDDASGTPNLTLVDRVNTERSDDGFGELGKLCTLLGWHLQDPVSQREEQRNRIIYSWQGNRNPFIDRPEYAGEIFGSQCGLADQSVAETAAGNEVEALKQRMKAIRQTLEQLVSELDAIERDMEALEDR